MLAEQISADLRTAMKARDRRAVAALRMVIARISELRSSPGHGDDVTDDEVRAIIAREAKRRSEASATFRDAGRTDLAETEEAELAVLRRYLPEQLSDDALAAEVDAAIAATGASSAGDTGRVMGAVMPRVSGRAEGARVRAMVTARLSG